ncbi:hypothetical protein ILUMI_10935 [Ignelater luminosus]|uniref:Uncharacterized protein n=1 Tax=Ignelater luminosus TaxID=2038154 RepID=A0A8K0CX72_IGNLU|nr:hypothetical protein ILUMI_10935 [Ignelater luminosus]
MNLLRAAKKLSVVISNSNSLCIVFTAKHTNKAIYYFKKETTINKRKKRDTVQFAEINKNARKNVKTECTKTSKGANRNRNGESKGKQKNIETSNIVQDRKEPLVIIESFYTDLYNAKIPNENVSKENKDANKKKLKNINSEELPEIEIQEVEYALGQIKNFRASGEDSIIPEMLKEYKQSQDLEIDRRISPGYSQLKHILNMKIPMKQKAKVCNECILLTVTYGAKPWVMDKKTINKLKSTPESYRKTTIRYIPKIPKI